MTAWRALWQSALFIFLNLLLTGCIPSSEGNLDEQKDAHYLNGRARVTTLDYKGAIEEFVKALETNPRNASAHLELALLYQEQVKNYATAIYHYERHLLLRPKSEYAERAKERIKSCKMDLVRTEIIGPVSQGMQRELERLTTENIQLKQRVGTLEAQLAGRPVVPVPTPQAPLPLPSAAPIASPAVPPTQPAANPAPPLSQNVKSSSPAPVPSRPARTYTVKAGDKLTTIAKTHGVELSKLLQANPNVDPARMQIGQTIKIP